MTAREFELQIIAFLNKQLSKKSINGDLRTLDNTMYVRVIAKLSKTLARKQLKSQLKELNDLYVKIGANVNIDKNAKARLQKNIQMLQQSISDLEIGLKASKYQQNKINAEIKSIRNKLQKDAENHPISFNLQVKKEKLISDLEYVGKRYSKLFSNVSATQKYEKIMSNAFNVSDKWQLADVRAELSAFTSELKANGLATQSTVDKWKTLVDRSKDLFSAATLVRVVFSQIRESISTFTELDTAMTGVWKVSNDITSREQFSGLLTKWNKLAQDLSVTTTSLINSIEEWSKIGFDLDMSEQLAELTTIFEKTAEISNELANKTLVSTAQAFTQIDGYGEKDYVERVEAIGNKINAVGNKYAISSEGISEALQNSSAALVMANNDLDEAIAMITAGNKIFQSPEEMGNTLKVVSARLRGQKGELEALGEDTEGMIEGVSKVQTQILNLTGNKVNIFEKDNETLKSTYDILLEVGKVFDSLSDKTKASLTEVMFGKQRMSAGSSLLLNYEELEQVKNDSINASNSMAEEYEKYMESTEASITKFKEKLIETYSVFMSGDMIKFAADTASAFLDLVNSTDLLRHSLLAIVSINVGKGLSAIGATVVSTTKQMNTLGRALEQVKNLSLDDVLRKKAISQLGDATKILTEKNLELLLSQKQLTEIDKIAILKKSNLTDEEVRAKLAKMQLTTATNNQSKANVKEATTTMTLSGAITSLKTTIQGVGVAIKSSFLNNQIGWVLTGITTAVSIGVTAMDNYNQKLEEQREQIKQTAEESSDHAQSLLELQKQLEDDTTSAEDLTTAFREQLRAMGYTETEIDTLIDKYGNLAGAINEATEKALENAKTDAYADVSTTGKSLVADAKGNTNIGTYYSQNKELSEEIQRMLEDSPAILDGGVFRMDKDASAEDIYEYYLVLKDISQLIQETANETGDDSLLSDSTPYYQVSEALDALSESAKLYGEAINRLHNADAQLELSDYLKTNDIDSQDAFDKYIEGIKDSTTHSDTYKEVLLEVANNAFPQFSSAVKSASDSVSDFTNESENLEELNENINTSLDSIQKSYDAVQEFKSAMSTGLTDSALNAVAGLSDELKALVAEFYAGTVSADDLFQALTDHYNNDLKNYSNAIIAKNQNNVEFCNNVGLNSAEVTNKFLEDYGIDLSNHRSYAAKKAEIEAQTLQKISDMWSDYYNTQTMSLTGIGEDLREKVLSGNATKAEQFSYNAIMGTVSNCKNAIEELNNITYEGIKSDFESLSSSMSDSSSSSSSSSTKETEKTFDWIETRISRIQRAVTNFGKTVSATYLDWSTRNKAVADEISSVNQEITTQQNAYERYMYEANKVGLSDYYKNLVQNGALDISTITDETLQKQIETYQDYYEKALSASDAVQELKDSLAELAQTKLDNISKESENNLALLDHELSMLEAYTERLELQGYAISSKATESMIKQNREQLPILEKQYEDMQNALQNAIDTGIIKIYSDAWHEAVSNIQDVQHSIEETTNTIIELQNTLREFSWETFDKGQEHISNLQSEFDFLIDLLEGNKMYDDNGITEHGQAAMGLHAMNYNVFMSQASDYAEEIKRINAEIANDPNNQTLIKRRNELLESQRDMISAAEDEKQAMLDLASDGYDTLLDKIKEITEKRKDMLSGITDMRDFEKNVKEQVEELDSLKKQLIAHQGDDSESSRATIQELQDKIKDAEENLEQTQYDKYIQDQTALLDKIYTDTEQWINERLDNEDKLLSEIIDSTNDSASSISNTISSSANEVGYTISNELGSILNGTGDLVAEYNDNFTNSMTTLQTSVDGIKALVAQMAMNANAGFDSINDHENTADSLSNMSAGWVNNNGIWSYNRDGAQVKNEWIKDNDKWYHLNDAGVMDSNTWIQNDSGTWSYVGGDGAALTGWQSLNWNGKTDWYAFDDEGTMKANTWVGDYFVGEGGQMLTHTWVGHDGTYYYVGDDGKWLNLPGWSLNERPNDGYPIYEYAKGSKRIPHDQLALLSEEGQEMQYDSSEGVLKVVGQGDMILTNEASKKLWEFSQDPKGYMAKLGFGNGTLSDLVMKNVITPNVQLPTMPTIQPKAMQNITIEFGDTNVTLSNVHNANDFAKEIKNVYAHNIGQVKTMIRQDVHGSALGKNMEAYKYL